MTKQSFYPERCQFEFKFEKFKYRELKGVGGVLTTKPPPSGGMPQMSVGVFNVLQLPEGRAIHHKCLLKVQKFH
jgi:hypothetical protein